MNRKSSAAAPQAGHAYSYRLNPLQDARWARFISRHPQASVFHSIPWLRALQRTYGYSPVVFTASPPDEELRNGIAFCLVQSWITGRRLVSLPFSDHCDPLSESAQDLEPVIRDLPKFIQLDHLKFAEFRPVDGEISRICAESGFIPAAKHFLHVLDLRPGIEEIFGNFDKDSVQRRIQRAERAGLEEKRGRSQALLKQFYSLFVVTRGRHQLPPTPYNWFQNLIEEQGEALELRLACLHDQPICGILTLRFKDGVHFKYGCSSIEFKGLGGTPWLLWRAICAAKASGASRFDFGRTEAENTGLLRFKNHWAPQLRPLTYWRFPGGSSPYPSAGSRLEMAKTVFSHMPKGVLKLFGKVIYRHIG